MRVVGCDLVLSLPYPSLPQMASFGGDEISSLRAGCPHPSPEPDCTFWIGLDLFSLLLASCLLLGFGLSQEKSLLESHSAINQIIARWV